MYIFFFIHFFFCIIQCLRIKEKKNKNYFIHVLNLKNKKKFYIKKEKFNINIEKLNKIKKKNEILLSYEKYKKKIDKYKFKLKDNKLKKLCKLINSEIDDVTKKLEIKIKTNFKNKNTVNQEIINNVENYWILFLKNKYFYNFLKNKKKYLIFSVSSGIDSLSTFYSFLFTIYKIIIYTSYKNELYAELIKQLKNVYSYNYNDIKNIVEKNDMKQNFFFNILKKIVIIYFDHKKRKECIEERNFLKYICKEYNIKFIFTILKKKKLEKLKKKYKNNFLQVARIWRRHFYSLVSEKLNKKINYKKKKCK